MYKTEVNLKIPNLKDLYCINCKINPLYMKNTIKSLFHYQILTCRLIIYSVRCCIASPSIESVDNWIHVIINKQFYYTGKLQKHLLNLQVQFSNPEPVHLKIYKACLKYMFTFKLAPLWNLIGKSFYLPGFSFLSLPCSIDTVEWNILFTDDDTKLEIKAMKMTLFPLTYEYVMKNSDFNAMGNLNNITIFYSSWVYVLPKLTKAKVVSVSKTLPSNCPFANYNDLRRYWKNMYSYHLPKVDQGMLFYEVIFPLNPNKKFIYPQICILYKMPKFFTCENNSKIISKFIKDLSTNIYSVCSEVIKIGHLFPELNIEYSYILKRKCVKFEKENVTKLRNNFLKTSNYIIKATNKKKDLVSCFVFSKLEKMSALTKIYYQKILSIIKSNLNNREKCKNVPIIETHCQYKIIINGKKYKEIISLVSEKENINNINIFSYYNLPSMNINNNNLEFISENSAIFNEKDEILSDYSSIKNYLKNPYLNLFLYRKLVIKNIENIYMILIDCKKFKTVRMHNNLNNIKQLIDKVQATMAINNSSLRNDKLLQMLEYSNKFKLQSEQCFNQLQLLSSTFNLYNIYKKNDNFKEIIHYDNKITDRSTSFKLRKKLFEKLKTSNFNHNIYKSVKTLQTYQKLEVQQFNKNTSRININIVDCLYNSLQYSPALLDKSKKKNINYLLETLSKRLFLKLYKSFQYIKMNEDKKCLNESRSLTTERVRSKLLKTYKFNMTTGKKKNIYISSSLQSIVNLNTRLEFKRQKRIKDLYLQNKKLNYKNLKSYNIVLKVKLKKETSQKLQYIFINQKLNKKKFDILFRSPVYKFNFKNKFENKLDLIICKSIQTTHNKNEKNKINYSIFDPYENQYKKIEDFNQSKQNFLKYGLNNSTTYKIPSSILIFNSNDNLENICSIKSLTEYSLNTACTIQNKKVLHRNTLNICNLKNNTLLNSNALQLNLTLELKNHDSNSMSILSQSSNEFNSDNYECYKLACTEALTFD